MSPHAYHLYRGNTAGFGRPVVPLIVFNLMFSGKGGRHSSVRVAYLVKKMVDSEVCLFILGSKSERNGSRFLIVSS